MYRENDPAFYLSLGRSSSRDYLILTISGNTTSEVRLIDANQPQREPQLFAARQNGRSITSITTAVSSTCVPTIRIRTLACTARRRRANRQTLIAPQAQHEVENFSLFRDWLVVQERANGLVQLRQISWDGKTERAIPFDDASYMARWAITPSRTAIGCATAIRR